MLHNPPIESLIYMFNHYKKQAEQCNYPDMVDWYFMYDYYMEMADRYERAILVRL